MIEQLESRFANVLGFKLSGKLHDEDYRKFVSVVNEAVARYHQVHLLAQFVDFHG